MVLRRHAPSGEPHKARTGRNDHDRYTDHVRGFGVTLGGGHTEITQGLDRPILVGQMLGEVAPTNLVRKTRIAIGDLVLLTRGVAIEGTATLHGRSPNGCGDGLMPTF